MKKLSTILFAAIAIFGTAQLANAQGFHGGGHYDSVPHSTTHTDYQRHGGHVDAVQHTTTHVDQVPHGNFSSRFGSNYAGQSNWNQSGNWNQSSNLGINSNWNQPRYRNRNVAAHTTTHTDYVPHGNHVDAQLHTTTHYDQVQRGYYRGH